MANQPGGQKPTLTPGRTPAHPPPPPPSPRPGNYLDTRCDSGRHYEHRGLTCEQIGDREWDPVTGYLSDAEAAATPPQLTGLAHLVVKES